MRIGDLYYHACQIDDDDITGGRICATTSPYSDNPYKYSPSSTSAIKVPDYVEYKGKPFIVTDACLMGSNFTKITLPSTLDCFHNPDYIGISLVHQNSDLKELTISEGATDLPMIFLYDPTNTSLKRAYIPKTIKNLWFGGMDSYINGEGFSDIEEIHVEDIASWCNAVMNEYSGQIPFNVFMERAALYTNGNIVKNLVIPKSVEKINHGVFSGCTSIEHIEFGNNITEIGHSSFQLCPNLKSIDLGNSVKKIGSHAFFKYGGSPIHDTTIPNSVEFIGNDAFVDVSQVYIADGSNPLTLTECGIGYMRLDAAERLYCGRNLKSIRDNDTWIATNSIFFLIPFEVFEIGSMVTDLSAFNLRYDDGYGSYDYESPLKTIISHATYPPVINEFKEEQYKTVELIIPPLSKHRYRSAPVWENFFKGEHLSTFRFLDMTYGVLSDGASASLTFDDTDYCGSIVIPEETEHEGQRYSVTSIGKYAFADCSEVTSVTVPSSVTTIETGAFTNCIAMDSLVVLGTVPPSCDITAFKHNDTDAEAVTDAAESRENAGDIFNNTVLYVPAEAISTYRNATGWQNFAQIKAYDSLTQTESIETSAIAIRTDGDGITVENAAGKPLTVYTPDGVIVLSTNSYDRETLKLGKGFYIVTVGDQALKVSI
ncbi:MAG: leucine-rich repeat domain-containing protein [Pseudoflavonifractor sp.]|nr:leucine-rich repeat domain-containing protein [Pseudoflavonifractor sp.]